MSFKSRKFNRNNGKKSCEFLLLLFNMQIEKSIK